MSIRICFSIFVFVGTRYLPSMWEKLTRTHQTQHPIIVPRFISARTLPQECSHCNKTHSAALMGSLYPFLCISYNQPLVLKAQSGDAISGEEDSDV